MTDTFSHHLRQRAEQDPSGIAVVDERGRMTNEMLNSLVDAVAAEILDTDASRIAVVASNSALFLAHAFAIWRAGRVLVTIYPSSPRAEIEYALQHSEVGLVFADRETIDRIPDGANVRQIERELVWVGRGDDAPVDPAGEALICYTSGSTQRPKAVAHSHSGILAGADAYAEVWHLGPKDVTLVVLPMAWAFGLVTTSMATLRAGGSVRSARRANAAALLGAIVQDGVTFVAGVTTIFAKLVDELETRGKTEISALRFCISGGEPRNEGVFSRWFEHTGVPVHDVYAASECFPIVTYDPVKDPMPEIGFAGRVAPGSELRLREPENGAWLPGAGVGEAYVKGAAQFMYYQGDPETTATVVTEDGWYRTGDLVEVREDGLVRVLGRLSGMIIRGGANVAPAEIERVVRGSENVSDAVAIGLPDEKFGQRIVVVVTAKSEHIVIDDEVLALCRTQLAGYKVPESVVVIGEFPLNDRTGKIDRRAVEAFLIGANA